MKTTKTRNGAASFFVPPAALSTSIDGRVVADEVRRDPSVAHGGEQLLGLMPLAGLAAGRDGGVVAVLR